MDMGQRREERPSIPLRTRNTIRSGRWKASKRANGKKRPGSMISGEDAFWSGMPSETKALRNMKPTWHAQPCHYAEGGGETAYNYDTVGRRLSISNTYGTVELAYNSRNFVTSRIDGKATPPADSYDRMGNLTLTIHPCSGKRKRAL